MIFPYGDDQVKDGHFPLFSYALIALNIAVFLYETSLPPQALEIFFLRYGATPDAILHGHQLYSLFTSMFLHGGWMHLIGNMVFLWIFADNIEAVVGNVRFLIFYFIGGLAAHALHIYFNPVSDIPTVGASGAISAVMGAYLLLFPGSKIRMLFFILPFRVPAFLFLLFWVFQQWLSGLASLKVDTAESNGVAWWAHIGGFAFGVLAGVRFRIILRHRRAGYPAPQRGRYR